MKATDTPEPQGKIHVRMPKALHADLLERKDEQGVSLNQLVVALIAGGMGFTLEPGDDGDG